jgi:Heterokaryon incompatibility protein (HET)
VLDIRLISGSSYELAGVKLIETQGQTGRYACLSHCWGNSNCLLTTTTATLVARKKSISWTSLPKSFQHAIKFAHCLTVPFLWIDSLCILQDNLKDWQDESACMATIYKNSYITLAATSALDGSGGFHRNDSDGFTEAGITTFSPDLSPCAVYARRAIPHLDVWAHGHKLFPLLKRAWVYQERLLSPRVLHFGDRELFWECMETMSCECAPFYSPTDGLKLGNSHVLKASAPFREIVLRWHEMVQEYTPLALSRPTDRLPAILGCAIDMQRFRKGRYLAGLWEDSLIEDLLWNVLTPAAPRPEKWRAPSWSWASVDGTIAYQHQFQEPDETYVQVFQASCTPNYPDSTPHINSGHLRLRGKVVHARLIYRAHHYMLGVGSGKFALLIDGHEEEVRSPAFFPDYDYSAATAHIPSGGSVYCLRMASFYETEVELSLVLRCVDHQKDGYERVGIVLQRKPGGKPRSALRREAVHHDTMQLVNSLTLDFPLNVSNGYSVPTVPVGPNWYERVFGDAIINIS